ncbi:MAG: hypothetical protein EZS28_022131 [Streblomastix strix]|uniref:Uncharacterized protein n=1 Tax=Streblomastix strix TaxID=222440 RepID=A0A5J4VJA5_9EUKA|nr:MAG: hypothetical protein EZS28_022131 [Streblomastix strix]
MNDILYSQEERDWKRNPHPLYWQVRQDGVTHSVRYNCLINGETDEINNNAAQMLGILFRAHEIKPFKRQEIISQLKFNLENDTESKDVKYLVDILCGLATKESNIAEILSNNFIDTLSNQVKSEDQDIKSQPLRKLRDYLCIHLIWTTFYL